MRTLMAVFVALMMLVPVTALAQTGPHNDNVPSVPATNANIVPSTDLMTMDLHFGFDAPSVHYGLGYGGAVHLLDQGGMQAVQYPGLPRVPVRTKVIELPGEVRVKDITETHGTVRTVYLPGVLETSPALMAVGLSGPRTDTQIKIYYNGARFPADWFTYELHRGLNTRGEDTVFVDLFMYPICYEGPEGKGPKLTYIDTMDVSIHYSIAKDVLSAPRSESYQMVIIGPEDFRWNLIALAAHKNMTGLASTFVSLDEIYNNKIFDVTVGRDNQEKIKYFIKDAIENWGIKYVLFGGDVDQVPVRHVKVDDGVPDDGDWVPSDIYYGDIYDSQKKFSSWDENNNTIYGEWINGKEDDPDMYEDVYVGRLPASNIIEISSLVKNIRNYENNTDWSWFLNAGLAGVDTWVNDGSGIPESEYGLDQTGNVLVTKGFVLHKMYSTKGTLSPQAINDAVNSGMGIVILSGHGSFEGWGDEYWLYYGNQDMAGLTNGVKLPIGQQSACDTGGFDDEDNTYFPDPWAGDSMSEEFLLQSGGGYIADVGSARLAFGAYGTYWAQCCVGYFERMHYKALIDGQGTPGRMLSQGRDDYMAAMGTYSIVDYKHMMEFNLMGDPSVAIGGIGLQVKALDPDVVLAPGQAAQFNFSVKNTGLWSISTNNRAIFNDSISTAVSPVGLDLVPGEEEIVTVDVQVNIDAIANTLVPVTLTAESSFNDRAPGASSNVTVSQVYGMDLTVDPVVRTAEPGTSVSFDLTVKNTGNGPDGAAVSFTDVPSGWGTHLSFSHVALTPFGGAMTTLTLDLPNEVVAGSYWLNVSASLDGAAIVRGKTLRVDISPRHEIAIGCDPCKASIDPGKTVQVPMNLSNKGNVPENITVNGTLPSGWTLGPDAPSYHISPYRSTKFNLTIVPPSKTFAGNYNVTVMANIAQMTVETFLTITVNRIHGLKFTVDVPELVVEGGKDAIFSAGVVNTGNGPETVIIENVSQPDGWAAQGEMQELVVPGYDTSTLGLYVTTKYETLAGDYSVTMRARAKDLTGLSDLAVLKVRIAERFMAQAKLSILTLSALPGKSTGNSVLFDNQGNVNETISLAFAASQDLVLTALTNKLLVQSLSSAETGFTITVKNGTLAGPHNYTVQVQRDRAPTIYLDGTITVLQVYGLDIRTVPSSYVVNNGGKLERKVVVTNRGNGKDTFTLHIEGLQASWASAPNGAIVLGPGQSKEVTITISPPGSAAPDKHQLTVRATSTSGVAKTAIVDYRVKDRGGTSTASSNFGLLPWLIIAVAIGFVVGRAVLKSRKKRPQGRRPGW